MGEQRWIERIGAGLQALLRVLGDEPQSAHLLILERPLEGVAALQCTQRVHTALAEVLTEAREEVIVGAELRPSTALLAELVVLGVLSVIRARMLKGKGRGLVDLAPSLMSDVVGPYLARGAERADLAKESAQAQTPGRAEMAPIRPHPRTMLALRVIASTPHLSDREIAAAAGIEEKARRPAWKLLKALERRGLIEDASPGEARDEPSAWLLTPYGRRVLALITDSCAAERLREGEGGLSGRDGLSRRAAPAPTAPGPVAPAAAGRRAA